MRDLRKNFQPVMDQLFIKRQSVFLELFLIPKDTEARIHELKCGGQVDKKEILTFISKNPIGFLGTVDGNAARVRAMDTFRADEEGLVFYTGKHKDVFKHITTNPDVEVSYFSQGIQIRVRGAIQIIEQLSLKKEIVEKKLFLKPFYNRDEDYVHLGVFILKGKATIWDKLNLVEPKTFIDL